MIARAKAPLLVLLLLGLAASCGSPEGTPTPPAPSDLRDRTVEALRGLSSASFEVSHIDDLGTGLGGGVTLLSAEGQALFPDRASLEAKVLASGFGLSLNMEIVQIGPDTYLKDPINSNWTVVEGGLPFNFVAMHNSLADALAATADLAVSPGETAGTWRLAASVPADAFRGIVPSAAEGEILALEALIGQTDFLPRRVRLEGKLVVEDPPEMVRFLDLPSFNRDVTIEPPV